MTEGKGSGPDESPGARDEEGAGDSPTSERDSLKDQETPAGFGDSDRASVAPKLEPVEAPPVKPRYGFLVAVSVVSLVLDLGSKWWAIENLQPTPDRPFGRVVVIEGLMQLVYAQNRGGAWGVLQDQHDWLRIPFFLAVSVVAIAFIFSMYRKLTPDQWALRWGLPLVLGGAAGNLVDRLRYGHVIDFIDVFVKIDGKTQHWPTFNVADIAIVVGVALMAVDMFTSRKPAPAKAPARAPR